MSKYIDAEKLIKHLEFVKSANPVWGEITNAAIRALEKVVECQPEAIVRCKYCRWGREVCGNIECFVDINIPPEYHGYEWFCPNGERKEE